ncbi:hypothetical protein MPL3365_170224 [Mesorhizobium plurifarium]|uniref:Uncharacterized protein n=1 Tax=Mesorhizobium plurifarium TaxID=69974 RepID=A0A090FZK8_MESPL|nr:hypothetical protein MPL3365_170224 [Mesorhizobium plurifarium]
MYSVGPGPTCVAAEWSWADQIRNARIRAWAGAVAPRAPETHKVTRGRNATEFTGRHQHSWASDDHHGQSNNGGIGDGGSGGPQLDHRRRAGRPCHQPGNSIARRRVDTAGTRMERPIAVANAEFRYRLRDRNGTKLNPMGAKRDDDDKSGDSRRSHDVHQPVPWPAYILVCGQALLAARKRGA